MVSIENSDIVCCYIRQGLEYSFRAYIQGNTVTFLPAQFYHITQTKFIQPNPSWHLPVVVTFRAVLVAMILP